jgi:predicted RNA-binding Zn-ribbon protein involved in translation (DUF1610 family)
MPGRRKVNLDKVRASLNTICMECGYSIPPSEVQTLDSQRLKCPKCGKDFVPAKRSR